jgi:guanylate kinase
VDKGKIIVISAPSGTGKTTIVRKILEEIPDIVFSVSATTRKKREKEIEGEHYFFLSEEEFLEKIENDEFVEWEKVYDYYYGTYRYFIEETINKGKSIILELDVNGAIALKKIYNDAELIYILPPDIEELVKRLKNRRTETEEDLMKRIKRAKMELSCKDKFDYLVVNKDLDKAIEETKNLILKITKK